MADIRVTDNTTIFQLKKWLGLNEAPDGDTGLKMGEASVMRNFRITREGHLQIRPGYAPMCTLAEGQPVRGLWSGYVNGERHLLAVCGGRLWDVDPETWEAADAGDVDDAETTFFGFNQKVYLLNGTEYYCWDGYGPAYVVDGYIPIVATAVPPEGGGTQLERVNLLNGKRRAQYSPDGAATVFQLPETELDELLFVTGTEIAWTADLMAGTITFETAPEKGVNTITIAWTKGTGERYRVTEMRFAELYNGAADSRVFLYGDGSNVALYSDLDGNGVPCAEYFPEMNEVAVASANTPITAMVRHHDRLLIFKSDGAYTTEQSSLTTDTGTVTAAFYTTMLHGVIGCAAPGQARLVQNDARTLFGRSVYQWALVYSSTRDERNAKRISERVEETLAGFDPEVCRTFDDERRQEYYILHGDQVLVHNYGNDTWYYYDHVPARYMAEMGGEVYFGTEDGRIMHFSRNYRNDNLEPIDAWWESGAMDFDQDWKRKYSANIWVSIKPESQARITVTAQSNRKSEHVKKEVASGLSTFTNANFGRWSFSTNRKPQVERVRLKVKKFTFYKLILSSCSASATATVLAADFQIRYTGNVK